VGPGDEVITTTTSWTSTATSVLHHNGIPVFVDIDWETIEMDPGKIEERINDRTKAIIVVHYWGLPCDLDPIMAIAKKHNLYVIEDACQAHGALYKGRKVGTFGHCSAFSLNQNKNFCAGEGGLFSTDDSDLLESARAVMNFGEMRAPEAHRDFHSYSMGWMYRTSDLPAAFARAQLSRLTDTNKAAVKNWYALKENLKGIPGLLLPYSNEVQSTNGYAFIIRSIPEDAGIKADYAPFRDAVALVEEGIPVASPRWLLPAHTVFQAKNGYGKGCPWSCHLTRKGIDYDLAQYPVSLKTRDTSIQIAINGHRPPNGDKELDYITEGVRKVFENLDQIRLK
jgi:Predicted pyridoxal phosphate-dependent enzyme apparently involved in regulation of cell wall biogenesis